MNVILSVFINPTVSKTCNNFLVLEDEVYHISRQKRNTKTKFNVFVTISINGIHKYVLLQNIFDTTEKKKIKLKIKFMKLFNLNKYAININKYIRRLL